MSVTFTVRMRFPEDARAEITDALRELEPASRAEPGCAAYTAHWVEGEPATVLIYEQYRDSAALEAHRGTPHFARWAVGVLYQRMLERSVEGLQAVSS
jgi:quinol monooxygenase YgiN